MVECETAGGEETFFLPQQGAAVHAKAVFREEPGAPP
jgi:hypothetical protein